MPSRGRTTSPLSSRIGHSSPTRSAVSWTAPTSRTRSTAGSSTAVATASSSASARRATGEQLQGRAGQGAERSSDRRTGCVHRDGHRPGREWQAGRSRGAALGRRPSTRRRVHASREGGRQGERTLRPRRGRPGDNNVATKVNADSKVINVADSGAGTAGTLIPLGTTRLEVPPPSLEKGSTDDLDASRYVGDAADRTGFSGLEAVDEVTMVAVPDLASAYEQGAVDLETFNAVQLAMIAHCEFMGNRVAILDTPPNLTPEQAHHWRVHDAGTTPGWPRCTGPGSRSSIPPAAPTSSSRRPATGRCLGAQRRTRGVHKAPANELVRGAISIQTQVTKADHDPLNPVGINCMRSIPEPRHPGLGSPDAVQRPGVAPSQRPPAVQLPRGVDPQRHPMGGLRAQRPRAVDSRSAARSAPSSSCMAQGCADGHNAR